MSNTNWIYQQNQNPTLSVNDKVKKLLTKEIAIKLVKSQFDELDRIKTIKNKNLYESFINYLYDHYVVNDYPKTYLCNHR